ncbi:MAG: hypothetical protein R2689_00330 [Microthrixaceae bacterium]|nr:hypothetical protein [Microthrixaceae bacterium]
MNENPDRVQQFNKEIGDLKLKASSGENESRLLVVGVVLSIAGLVLAIYGGLMVQGTLNEFNQRSYTATGSFIGLALLIAGAALFIRYSIARYLRFWLIRLVHESRANTDRIVEAIEIASGQSPER